MVLMALTVRFTDIRSGKITSPKTTTDKEAQYVFGYGKRVATALTLIELLDGAMVIKSVEVGS